MNLHEYQAKQLLREFGVPVLDGYVAHTPREAQKAAMNLGGGVVVVKAQVHAGGRGKAGGVKVCRSPREAFVAAEEILGMTLISPQTGPRGRLVRKVLVEAGAEIKREFYMSFIVDRARGCVSAIASREGGVEIEEVASVHPERIKTVEIRPETGIHDSHCRRIGLFLGLTVEETRVLSPVLKSLYRAFLELDCSLLEINPLVELCDGSFVCLDAKVSVDDNALFRQRRAHAMLDLDEIDERELRAAEVGINYVALSGNIGCMVNGAGLAMATMDIIQQAGGAPANFLDVGGGANAEMVREAFRLILQDQSVKGVLVNIFGGIMRCDVIAEGIIEAAKTLEIAVPLVVRLSGTNVEIGKAMLERSGLKITPAHTMDEAAERIVAAVRGGG